MVTNKKRSVLELEKRRKGRKEENFIFGTQYKRQNFTAGPILKRRRKKGAVIHVIPCRTIILGELLSLTHGDWRL
jgi:hypothetical protein